MIKKIFFTAVSTILSVVIFLVLSEVIIRAESLIKGGRIWTPDKYFHIQHIPNTDFTNVGYKKEYVARGKVNNWGFMGNNIGLKKPGGIKRVLMLGDSYTEAVQVDMDKSYSSRLGQLLGDGYQVINAGISDYSPKLEYLYLRDRLMAFEPDIIILQLFTNDVYDDYKYGELKESMRSPLRRSVIYNHSHLYHYILRQRAKLLKKILKKHNPNPDPGIDQFFFVKKGNERLKKELWKNTERYLLKIKELAKAGSARLIVFAMPIEAQVGSGGKMSPASQFYFEERPTDDFDSAVRGFCEANNVEFIDMPGVFRDNKNSTLYYPQDGHLTESGHALVGDVLYGYLK